MNIGSWDPVTDVYWQTDSLWQIYKLEQDVEFEGRVYHCVILSKLVSNLFDPGLILYAEDIFSEAWEAKRDQE